MVTALALQIFLSLGTSRESTPSPCREFHASTGFLLATGALIASGNPRLSMVAFIILVFYFQLWRILDEASRGMARQEQSVYLPETRILRHIFLAITRDVRDSLRGHRKVALPLTGAGLMRWLVPTILIVILFAKKGVSA
ncbi:hypothetical protein EBZ80_01440 [bacterium]|nr:hypothetical protein [bacterium]